MSPTPNEAGHLKTRLAGIATALNADQCPESSIAVQWLGLMPSPIAAAVTLSDGELTEFVAWSRRTTTSNGAPGLTETFGTVEVAADDLANLVDELRVSRLLPGVLPVLFVQQPIEPADGDDGNVLSPLNLCCCPHRMLRKDATAARRPRLLGNRTVRPAAVRPLRRDSPPRNRRITRVRRSLRREPAGSRVRPGRGHSRQVPAREPGDGSRPRCRWPPIPGCGNSAVRPDQTFDADLAGPKQQGHGGTHPHRPVRLPSP
jgi:hypothetical protein